MIARSCLYAFSRSASSFSSSFFEVVSSSSSESSSSSPCFLLRRKRSLSPSAARRRRKNLLSSSRSSSLIIICASLLSSSSSSSLMSSFFHTYDVDFLLASIFFSWLAKKKRRTPLQRKKSNAQKIVKFSRISDQLFLSLPEAETLIIERKKKKK